MNPTIVILYRNARLVSQYALRSWCHEYRMKYCSVHVTCYVVAYTLVSVLFIRANIEVIAFIGLLWFSMSP